MNGSRQSPSLPTVASRGFSGGGSYRILKNRATPHFVTPIEDIPNLSIHWITTFLSCPGENLWDTRLRPAAVNTVKPGSAAPAASTADRVHHQQLQALDLPGMV